MFIAQRYAETRIFQVMRDAGAEFTVAQGRLLARIAPGGSRISDLAEQAQITKQTATSLIDRLEEAGIVERVPDPTDGRARLVRGTTETIDKYLPIARREEARIEAEWTEHLGEESMAQLRDALTRLREITDPFAD
ncbi:MarR family transcriptional regulator [Gulosibacter molinativorax]|uniref:MarR family transcriptional regulator n=2 Tax=Gulosibacter molinativorax TaxID=256821 RepID=A0ABT7CCB6_9MICO|nr:MarR family transcriptional regulator [Gulosibacter molinativorax]